MTWHVRLRRPNVSRAAFIGDVHFPFHDTRAIALALDFVKWFKPQFIYLIGDLVDFYQMSRFDKDPQRLLSLQDDLDMCVEFIADIRKRCPAAKLYFREGNHEFRLTRFLWAHPEIAKLRNVQLDKLLDFAKLRVNYTRYNGVLTHNGFLVEHGDIVRKHSAATACAMLDKRQVSGIVGHCHRAGMHYRTDETGMKFWVENPVLCRTDPEYVIGKPNWQQGLSVLYDHDGRQWVDQVLINQGGIFYQGNVWDIIASPKILDPLEPQIPAPGSIPTQPKSRRRH